DSDARAFGHEHPGRQDEPSEPTIGSHMINVEPRSTLRWAARRPPWDSTIWRTIVRPKPRFDPFSTTDGSIPFPSSATATHAQPSWFLPEASTTRDPAGDAFKALSVRLLIARRSVSGTPSISAGVGLASTSTPCSAPRGRNS